MEPDQFLDLVFYYRLQTAAESEHEKLIDVMAGQFKEVEKPQMQTEAARNIPVPSWWQGETTLSDAVMISDRMRRRE